MNDMTVTPEVATVPAAPAPRPYSKLKFEYGMELTWVGKPLDIFKKGEAAIKAAFPIAEDTAPTIEEVIPEVAAVPEPEQAAVAEVAIAEQTNPVLEKLLGLTVEQMTARFVRQGLSADYADREAKRLAKEFVLFDLGVISHIDPYKSGNTEKTANTAWSRQSIILESTVPTSNLSRSPRRGRSTADVTDEVTPTSRAQGALTTRIVQCLKERWEPIGYRDKVGVVGVQWNNDREIEITSFVHRTMEQAEVFYNTAVDGFASLGVPMETSKDAGGGGHLHVTYNKRGGALKRETMFNLVWDTIARPYINWAFNDPNDASTSRAPIENMEAIMGKGNFGFSKGAAVRWATPGHRGAQPDIDDYGAISNYTTEFRCLQMPKTWEEQRLHIEFIEAWAGAAEKPGYFDDLEPIRPYRSSRAKGYKSAEQCLQMLGEFLVLKLGLDYDAYRPIIERNLVTKFTHYSHELT